MDEDIWGVSKLLEMVRLLVRYMSDHNVSEHYYSLARKYLQYVSSEGLDSR